MMTFADSRQLSLPVLIMVVMLAGQAFALNTLDRLGLGAGTPAAAAYSVRKLSSAYAGYAINVRRSSDDATQDIGFTAGGDLDQAALLSFVGSGFGYVATWYDQSGSGANVTQAANANQPRIVASGVVETNNSMPALYFGGATQNLIVATPVAAYPVSISIIANTSGSSTNGAFVKIGQSATPNCGFGIGVGNPDFDGAGTNIVGLKEYVSWCPSNPTVTYPAVPFSLEAIQQNAAGGNTLSAYLNGTNVPLSNANNAPNGTIAGNLYVGGYVSNTPTNRFPVARQSEVIVFGSALSNADRQTIECNQLAYYAIMATATVGVTQSICGSLTSNSLGGNTPTLGTGAWTKVSGPGTVNFSGPAAGNSTATVSVAGTYVLRWTITYNTCTSTADLTVIFLGSGTLPTANVTGSTSSCPGVSNNVTVSLTGAQPWSLTRFDGTNSTNVTGIASSPYVFSVAPTTTKTYTVTALTDATCSAVPGGLTGSAVITIANGTLGTTQNAAAAYSVRKVNTCYAGYAMNVRRSSDNATQDIGFTAGGDLNQTALLSFVGAGSGYICKWYDQSGNGKDIIQAATANQPRIVNAGVLDVIGSRPALYFGGPSQNLSVSVPVAAYPLTVSILANTAGGSSNGAFVKVGQDQAPNSGIGIGMGNATFDASGTAVIGLKEQTAWCPSNPTVAYPVSAFTMVAIQQSVAGGSGLTAYLNGAAVTLSNATTATNGTTIIGNLWVGGYLANGTNNRFPVVRESEVILFGSALSNGDRGTIETSQQIYFGIVQVAPVASGVSASGTIIRGKVLTGAYTYSDANNDLEGTSTFKWYRSNDAAGTGKTAIAGATSQTYTLAVADSGKYISFEVTPVAQTGTSPGAAVEGIPRLGPIDPAPNTSVGPVLWLLPNFGAEKSAGVPAANNDVIQYWRDMSGNGNDNTQATVASRPKYVQNVVNGRPVIRFNGTNQFTSFTSAINNARTLFAVIKFTGAQVAYTPIWGHSTALNEYLYNSYYLESTWSLAGYVGGAWYENGSAINPLATAYKTTWAIVSVVTSVNVSTDQITKDRADGTRCFSADVAEMLIYNSALGTADVDSVTSYLGGKYGIAVQRSPVASSVSKSGTLQAGQVLTGSYVYSDVNGDLEGTSTFKWYRANDAAGTGSTAIGGAASLTYILAFADIGKYIAFEVTPVALTGKSPGAAVKSSYTGAVAAAPQVAPVASAVSVSGNRRVGSVQSGVYTYSDANNDLEGASTFKWYLSDDASGTNKTAITGATGSTYTPVSGDKGHYLSFGVTPVALTGTSPGAAVESSPRLLVRQAITFDTTGLLLWVDGGNGVEKSSGVSAGNGEAVQYWRDQSVQVNDFSQATLGSRPLLVSSSLNGQDVVRFDGVDDFMSYTSAITTARTLFVVIKFAGAQANYTPIWGHSAVVNQYLYNSYYLETTYSQAGYVGGAWYENSTSITPTTTTYKTTWAIVSVVTSATVSTDQITSDRNMAGRFMGADVAEMLIYGSVLTATKRQAVETYLGNKYNITVAQLAPVASNVLVSGTLDVGNTATGTYVYSDANGDLQGTSTFKWYRSNDALGTGKAAIAGATATTYTLVAGDNGKWLSFEVTPVALTGTTPGTAAESPLYGPVNQVHSFWSRAGLGVVNGGAMGQTAAYIGTGTMKALVAARLSNGTNVWSFSTNSYGDCNTPSTIYSGGYYKIAASAGTYVFTLRDDGAGYTQLAPPTDMGSACGTPYTSPDDSSFIVVYTNTVSKRRMDNGNSLWSVALTNASKGADLVVYSDNVYAATTDGKVVKGDAADFTPLSTYQLSVATNIKLPLSVVGDTLLFTPDNDTLYGVNATTLASTYYKVWLRKKNTGPAFATSDSSVVYAAAADSVVKIKNHLRQWAYGAGDTVFSGPICMNSVVYFGRKGGQYFAIRDNGATASLIATWPYQSASGNCNAGPWIDITNNRAVFGSTGGNLDAFPLQ